MQRHRGMRTPRDNSRRVTWSRSTPDWCSPDHVIARHANACKFDPKEAYRLGLGNLPGDPQGAAGEFAVALRQVFGLLEQGDQFVGEDHGPSLFLNGERLKDVPYLNHQIADLGRFGHDRRCRELRKVEIDPLKIRACRLRNKPDRFSKLATHIPRVLRACHVDEDSGY